MADRDRRFGSPVADLPRVLALVDPSISSAGNGQVQEELKAPIGEQLNGLLGIVYGLALSVIVSLFGIVNTLALSIHERTASSASCERSVPGRCQVRRVVRYESVVTTLIDVLGIVLGVMFAGSRPLADEGFTLSIPIGRCSSLCCWR